MLNRRFSKIQTLFLALCTIPLFLPRASADLTHRYSFTDAAAVKDSVGTIDGQLQGGAIITDGKLDLKNEGKNSGDDGVEYVDFPDSLLPDKGSASLVIWFTAKDISPFARILDIGDQDNGEGKAFICFTPRNAADQSRAAITATDASSKTFQDNDRLDDGALHMVALVVDAGDNKLHVYIDGKQPKPGEDLGQNVLAGVHQDHTWLGRSAFDNNPGLTGSISEFRVYDNALAPGEVAAVFAAGPQNLPTTQPSAAK